jgi:hypothetical protein
MEVSGDLQGTFEADLDSGRSDLGPEGIDLVWGDFSPSVELGAPASTGTRSTAEGARLFISIEGEGWQSPDDGPCDVSVDRVDSSGVEGSFTCTGLEGDNVIDVTGTFSATA